MNINNNFVEAIGNTPLIKLNYPSKITGCNIYGKAEFLNPGGSIKDRAAKAIILDAIKDGKLKDGGTIVEGTAGNTGIGLGLVGNSMGFKTIIVMPETQSQEKKDALNLIGCELKLVPALPYSNPGNYIRQSETLANELNNTIVINGNGLDEEVLIEANLEEAETVLALTNDDEDNLMVSVLVEKFAQDEKFIDDKRTMALINKPNYSLLQNSLKIDDLIDPRMNTVSSILKHIHKGTIETAYTIMDGEYEVIEAEIIETSELINKEFKNSNLPDEIRIGAVLREDNVIIPRSNFVFQKDDKVVFLAKKDSFSLVENIFRISSI